MVTAVPQHGVIQERLEGIVDRVTYHNPDNGWSILRITPFNAMGQETVVVHQTRVFAGATMLFQGAWTVHPKFGRQFQAVVATEKKPATQAALEKYLGSGLIKGVGPKTALKIVKHFQKETLTIFENNMERLTEVPGIALKKLEMIRHAWTQHKSIREVMMFLQTHGISTLFAVRIYKTYGDKAIANVTEDPYRLANDFYGIGFFSADKVALSIGLDRQSPQRIMAGIRHVVAAGRNDGHCYLTYSQIDEKVKALLDLDLQNQLSSLLDHMVKERQLMLRELPTEAGTTTLCYYVRSLYFDERYVAKRVAGMGPSPQVDRQRIQRWIELFCKTRKIDLSQEQALAVGRVVGEKFSILTGGPGCGKTTTTQVIVKLAEAMGLKVLLAAPTGRAAQRMGEVIGREAKTIHRLLEWKGGEFKKNESQPLDTEFLIVDECSMLDISLTAALLKAVPQKSQVLFIGDADQLPSVGAGNVLRDIISADTVPCFRLTQIFRQARESKIIQYAHQINRGEMPWVISPFKKPSVWQDGSDCLFMDSDEATGEQIRFIDQVKRLCHESLVDSKDPDAPKTSADNFQPSPTTPRGSVDNCQTSANDSQNNASPALASLHNSGNRKNLKKQAGNNGMVLDLEGPSLVNHCNESHPGGEKDAEKDALLYEFRINETVRPYETEITIPAKFQHVNLTALAQAGTRVEELTAVLKKVHPWSSLHYGFAALDVVKKLYLEWIPKYFGTGREIQILSPMTRGTLGTANLNLVIQNAANPFMEGKPQLKVGERIFRLGDRVIHRRNNYDLGVFNGDIGSIVAIDNSEPTLTVAFYPDQRQVFYQRDDIMELDLAWAITIHKSQGSEFEVVIIPVLTQHYKMLFRNLLYTGLTRAKKLAVFVGTRKAMSMAVRNQDVNQRQTALDFLCRSHFKAAAPP